MNDTANTDVFYKINVGKEQIVTDNLEKAIIHFFPDSVHSVDQQGIIIFANQSAEKLLGYGPGELTGKSLGDLYDPEVLSFVKQGFENLKREGHCAVSSSVLSKNNERIPVEIRSFCIYDQQGEFQKTITIMRDLRNYMYALSKNKTDNGWTIQWASVQDATYSIEWAENLDGEFLEINDGIKATPPMNQYTDYFQRDDPGVYRILKEQ